MFKRTILIVDDQPINRKILGQLLERDYDILYAENGKEALDCMRENIDRISAVLLDIVMPVMDGYQVLEILGKDPQLSKIPVIVSSQKDGDTEEVRALTLGAQDFIAKPYKVDVIRHRLENTIRFRETAAMVNRTERDEVTGLFNKQFFMQRVAELLRDNPDKEYDIICFGVERFKLINDTYGIAGGDKVLHYLGSVLQDFCHETKICGRFEADNFYGILPHQENYTNETFRGWLDSVKLCPVDMDLKLNTGIYYIQDKTIAIPAMCDRAQLASEENRGKYDENFYLYDESIRDRLLGEQFIINHMQSALQEQQFTVYYQPKYELNREIIAGAEALVRWIHPERGFMSPGEFVPLFERNGFIIQLDEYVWERACRDIRSWIDQGIDPVAVSVNVSRADIYNPKLVDVLCGLLEKYDIPIQYLHLEITESAYTENPKQIIEVVSRLRELGFSIEMDDFGSGYSSLNMLAEMPVDVLKLDIGFIQSETREASGKGILSFVVSLAKWLNLAVVAEGVETKEQIEVLRSMDCNYVQGYYFARPMKEEDFRKLILENETTEMVCTSQTTWKARVESQGNHKQNEKKGVMLIVDDIEINRAVLASLFEEEYQIKECENGEVAWKYLQENSKEVAMIMLDLLMPVMDGFQLLQKIRAAESMKNLPVIITSQGDSDSERRALEMRADDFISKPYHAEIIRHRVMNVAASYELRMIKGDSREAPWKELERMAGYFDTVRLVDPRVTMVYETEGQSCESGTCFTAWGQNNRCVNCTSLRAFEQRTRCCKLQKTKEGLFFVLSRYVPYGEDGAVMEMIIKLENDPELENLMPESEEEKL